MLKGIISFTIRSSKEYPHSMLQIQSWFCEKKEFANRKKSIIEIRGETDKAMLIEFVTGEIERYWIPKSVCRIINFRDGFW